MPGFQLHQLLNTSFYLQFAYSFPDTLRLTFVIAFPVLCFVSPKGFTPFFACVRCSAAIITAYLMRSEQLSQEGLGAFELECSSKLLLCLSINFVLIRVS